MIPPKKPTRPPVGPDRPAPTRPRLWVETYSPQTTRQIRVTLLNDWIAGFYTHFLPGTTKRQDRTKPCLIEQGGCEWHELVKNRKWKGYIGALVEGMRRPVLLEITEGCYEQCQSWSLLDGQLRGHQWLVWRKQDSNRSPMLARKSHTFIADPPFPKVDAGQVLSRLWVVALQQVLDAAGTDDGAGGWGHPSRTNLEIGNVNDNPPPPVPGADTTDQKKAAEIWRKKRGL